jgi:hypothetical protein
MRQRFVLALLHWLLGIVALFTAVAGFVTTPVVGDRDSFAVLAVLALFLILVAVGLQTRRRWLVVTGAVPVALVALGISALVILGGWVWGPQQANRAHLISLMGLVLGLIEVVSMFTKLRADETTSSPP